MRAIIIIVLALAFMYGCTKSSGVSPNAGSMKTTTNILDTSKAALLIAGIKNAAIFYKPNDQVVQESVSGNKLYFLYQENVNLLIDSAKYNDSWYVYFLEDWSKSALTGLDYTTLLSWGATATNYVPANLNQITKTVKDTVIAQKTIVKVSFARSFNFVRTFATAQLAVKQRDSLLNVTDHVTFTTKYLPSADTTLHNQVTLNLKYISSN